MKLRVRLTLLIGVALSVLWAAVALWMQHDLDRQMQTTLDRRLQMAAEMVGRLVAQNPAAWNDPVGRGPMRVLATSHIEGLACEVSAVGAQLRGAGAGTGKITGSSPGFANLLVDGEWLRTYTMQVHGMHVTTSDRLPERALLSRNIMLAALVPFLVAMTGGLAVLWFGVGSGLHPLERLRQALARRSHDQLTPVARDGMPVDLHPFVDTLNDMLVRIATAVRRERRFTSDAAHELRTPLTAIKVHLDVARLAPGSDTLAHAQEGVNRLRHTLEQLLTLAQVEGEASWDGWAMAQSDVVAYLAAGDAAPSDPAAIAIEGDGDNVALAIPQALAVTALRNLLDNALRHASGKGPVRLLLEVGDAAVRFSVHDDGPGMDEQHSMLAVERFWRRGTGPGSGLGLSIVDAIASRFGGTLQLSRAPEGGLAACITLPRA